MGHATPWQEAFDPALETRPNKHANRHVLISGTPQREAEGQAKGESGADSTRRSWREVSSISLWCEGAHRDSLASDPTSSNKQITLRYGTFAGLFRALPR